METPGDLHTSPQRSLWVLLAHGTMSSGVEPSGKGNSYSDDDIDQLFFFSDENEIYSFTAYMLKWYLWDFSCKMR